MFSPSQARHAEARVRNKVIGAGLVMLALCNILFGLAGHGIINGNESLYVESAREMLRSGEWIVPTLNGLPYVEKPPLFDWLLMGSFRLLGGIGEAGARLVSVLATLLLALALARFSSLLRLGGAPWRAAFIYLTSFGVVIMASAAMPDALLNSLFCVGCLAFIAALRGRSRALARIAALSLGLACLTKGLLPLALFGLILAAYLALKRTNLREALDLGRDYLVWGLLFVPLLVWLAAAEASLPGVAYRFLVEEHVLRFLGLREPNDYYSGPVFYYVPRLFLFAFPWIGVLIFGWAASRGKRNDDSRDTRHFLWACVWVPFAFFSLSQAKANYYVTLCLPPLALLTADYLQVLLRKKRGGWLILGIVVPTLVLLAIFALRAWAIATGRAARVLERSDGSFPLTTAAVLMLCIVLVALAQFNWRRAAALGIGILIIPLALQLHHLLAVLDPQISARKMAGYINANFSGSPVFLYRDYEAFGALPIYLDRNVPVIDSASNDLYFGRKLLPEHPSLLDEAGALGTADALVVVLADREKSFRKTELWEHAAAVCTVGKATLYRLGAEEEAPEADASEAC